MNVSEQHVRADAQQALPLWIAVLGGPVAWFVLLNGGYASALWVCRTEHRTVLHGLALAALVLSLGGSLLAWKHWRAIGRSTPSNSDEGQTAHVRFLSILGQLSGGLFALVIVAEWLAIVWLDPCVSQ